ncbi:MAG: hypothetical protein K5798_03635 [Nitrosopumilus sp.]|uniref:hypothetical protein n=1 Tax=Nitrosopumilus sp. TaxID=2024843 RepID=UPI002432053B|nr:hypothetical protein [Nitrosopumilus sp.]MCV0366344.1 hypothetical protein [Nitrosopumilus sp.]
MSELSIDIPSLLIGGIISILASVVPAVYYAKKAKKEKDDISIELKEIRRKYSARTPLMNLRAMFDGGDERAPPIKSKLDYWKCQLDGYCKEYQNEQSTQNLSELVKMINDAEPFPNFDLDEEGNKRTEEERNALLKKPVKENNQYQEIVKKINGLLGMNSFQHGLDKQYSCD